MDIKDLVLRSHQVRPEYPYNRFLIESAVIGIQYVWYADACTVLVPELVALIEPQLTIMVCWLGSARL